MTSNLLTLSFSKTEFLLTGLKKQLDKMHNSSLNTTHSARNLGFISDEHLTFSYQFWPSPKLAVTISDSSVVSVLTLIPPQLVPLPPPSFTPNLITVILYTTTYLSLSVCAPLGVSRTVSTVCYFFALDTTVVLVVMFVT